MNNLKENFEKLDKKYLSKKEYFKKIINKWWSQGSIKKYKQAEALLEKLENLNKEFHEGFTLTVEGRVDKSLLKIKYKEFKQAYKTLNEITKPIWRQWIEAILVAGTLVFVLRTYVFGLYHVPTGSAEKNILVGDRIWGNKMRYFITDIKRGDLVIFDDPTFEYDRSNKINYLWQKYIGFPIPLIGLGNGPDNWVKRVIAIPGDTIEGKLEDGKTVIYLNGQKIDETAYVNPYPLIGVVKTTGFINLDNIGPILIPSFLRKKESTRFYTYDPSVSYQDQIYYNMTEEEIFKINNKAVLLMPYSPTYEHHSSLGAFGKCVDEFGPYQIPEGKYWVMGDSRKNSRDSRFWLFLDKDLIHGRASFIIYSVDSEEPLWLFELLKHPIDFWFKSIRYKRTLNILNNFDK